MKKDLLFRTKRPKDKEISVVLFEQCNNRCLFCYQYNGPRTNASVKNILSKIEVTKKAIDEISIPIKLKLLGGELFCDEYDDSIWDAYLTYLREIKNYCDSKNKSVYVGFATNLFLTNVEKLKKFLQKCDSIFNEKTMLSTSFDFWGRFNEINSVQKWKSNLHYFKDRISVISMVLTKQNIENFISHTEIIDDLYKDFKIFFEYYNPDTNSFDTATPSDELVFSFFKYLIENYPDIMPVQSLLENKPKCLYCESLVCINSLGKVCACRSTSVKNTNIFCDGDYEKDISNDIIEQQFVDKYGCDVCPYFKQCPLGCFMFFNLKQNKRPCIFKSIFEGLQDGSIKPKLSKMEIRK